MSDSKTKDDNDRDNEGYKEGRSWEFDPLKSVVDGLFLGGDEIKDAERRAGKADRERYDSGPKIGSTACSESSSADRERNSLHTSGTSSSREPSSFGYSGGSSGSLSGHGSSALEIVPGLLFLAAGIAYIVWVISTMNNGGPDSLGEFVLPLPGVGVILYWVFMSG
jgi:hypothetical protein